MIAFMILYYISGIVNEVAEEELRRRSSDDKSDSDSSKPVIVDPRNKIRSLDGIQLVSLAELLKEIFSWLLKDLIKELLKRLPRKAVYRIKKITDNRIYRIIMSAIGVHYLSQKMSRALIESGATHYGLNGEKLFGKKNEIANYEIGERLKILPECKPYPNDFFEDLTSNSITDEEAEEALDSLAAFLKEDVNGAHRVTLLICLAIILSILYRYNKRRYRRLLKRILELIANGEMSKSTAIMLRRILKIKEFELPN